MCSLPELDRAQTALVVRTPLHHAPQRSYETPSTSSSADERRLPLDPRSRRFDLRGEPQEHRLIAEPRDELDCKWQPSRRAWRVHLAHREHDRRLTRDVEPHSKRGERKYTPPILVHILEHHVDPPQLDGAWRRQPWGEEHVIFLMERGHLAADPVGGLSGPHVVGRR